ncbi:MAG TPA: SDR family oxidoreductase [Acidimicrobiales bacterium]|nr:SDR family oxidoreductase [Acidimicrobiales bacterium]
MTIFMTGFPGFLGSALLPRIMARTGEAAVCLVQPKYQPAAELRVKELVAEDESLGGRISLVAGDITVAGLGLSENDGAGIWSTATEIWHLAAVYDLTVEPELAMRVNVDGTRNVLDAAVHCERLRRFHYFSTCYVSGRYPGPFSEEDLEVGAPFQNHYEATKHLAEVEVRRRMVEGLAATIYRPSIAVGDSRTGETQKYDGPYFALQLLLRQPRIAVLPVIGDPSLTSVNVVPRDFVVAAAAYLSGLPQSAGRTYALADPHPLTVAAMVDVLAEATGRRVIRVPLPRRLAKAAIRYVPGVRRLMRMPPELVDYFADPTWFLTTNTTADLEASGIAVPPLATYAGRLVEYMRAHPEVGSEPMV